MQKHLSSRFALRSVVSAAAVALAVVTPVAVAAPAAVAQPVAATTATAAGVTTEVGLPGSFALGQRTTFTAAITNGTGAALKNHKGLVTVAYGKHVNAALEPMTADPSKILVQRLNNGVWERLTLTTGANGAVQATFALPAEVAAGATVQERFQVTISTSIPADATMGEVGVAGNADGTGLDRIGFGLGKRGTSDRPEVVIGGLEGRPELTAGGKPVRFTGTITNNTGKDIAEDLQDFFFVSGDDNTGDLDPQHVTLERRDASGAWVPVRLGEQDRAVQGGLDHGGLKAGASRTYTLRLGLTSHFPRGVKAVEFALISGDASAAVDFGVKQRAAGGGDADVSHEVAWGIEGVAGVTSLKAGGAGREFTATVTNKGNVTQRVEVVMSVVDRDGQRRIAADRDVRVQQHTGRGWSDLELRSPKAGGHLGIAVEPYAKELAPGEGLTYRLRVVAPASTASKGFFIDLKAAGEGPNATGKRLPFVVAGAPASAPSATPGASTSPSAVPVAAAATGVTPRTSATGEMAKTGNGTTTPLLVGAAGVLVAGGAASLLIARRRAL
ncbi:hypothetical protein ACFPM3_23300 [Streptomyces coeruleoprunus]|uniref:LPXTG cell wall anchor domain-containing protein n=1 Tax=Streptomyces coeruleoprunus TaxID=285563 RepID=A0ABV9XNE3_9ACTN